nr:hypothetical protein [Tanacetum cinerariifolium]
LACHNVVEVDLAEAVGGDVVVEAADGDVGIVLVVGDKAYSLPKRDP